MHLSPAALLTLLATTSLASATFTRGQKFSWGCDQSTKDQAPKTVKDDCSAKGSFLSSLGGKAICCSDKTRTTTTDCPLNNWKWNKKAGCCIPPTEICERDCGEGYTFNKNKMKCEQNQPTKCGKGLWWHERSKECCTSNPGTDKGKCPTGITCPKEWHWSIKDKKCKPDTPRAPEPDCDDWNGPKSCCGGHGGQPSKGTNHGGNHGGNNGGNHGGHGGHSKHKRDVDLRRSSQLLFPQSETDKLYCPGQLRACSVSTTFGGEWAYECIDVASELESCGGCASTGEGQDCTKIEHAVSVGCNLGVCKVNSCQAGFAANGTACIPA